MSTTKLANAQPELQSVRETLEAWQPGQDLEHFKSFLLARLDVIAAPAIYDAVKKTLTCPHCGFEGIIGGEAQEGEHSSEPFRYLEDIVNHRDVEGIDENGALRIDSFYESGEGYDDGDNLRLECRKCLAECALPAGLEIEFE